MSKYRTLIKNLFALSFAEIFNKGIVFVTTAYLGRVLEPEGFALISFANSFLVYFLLIVNLGFGSVGTREIASNQQKLSQLVNTIISFKILLSVVAYSLLFLAGLFLDKSIETKVVVWIVGLNVFFHAIMLDWVYQGIEKMEIIALRQVITSSMNLVGILVFVHNPDDIVIAVVISLISFGLNSLWMFLHYQKKYLKFRFTFDYKQGIELVKPTLIIAIIQVAVAIYTNSGILLLGILRTDLETGLFAGAFKTLMLLGIISAIIQNSFYPLLSRANTEEERKDILYKYIKLMFFVGTIISVSLFAFSDEVIVFVFGDKFLKGGEILKILMVQSFFSYFSVVGMSSLLAWKQEFNVMKINIVIGSINLILGFVLTFYYGGIGAGITFTVTEFLLNVLLVAYIYKLLRFKNYGIIIVFLLLAVVSAFAAKLLTSYGVYFLISIGGGILLYFVLSALLGLVSVKQLIGQFKNAN